MATNNELKLTLNNLETYFKKIGYTPIIQEEENQVEMQVRVEKIEFPFFAKIREEGDLIQLLIFFPCNTLEGSEGELARCLHLLNKELDIPGFGMDDLNGLIFYRVMIPTFNDQFNPAILDKFSSAIPDICSSFFPLIFSMSQGKMKYSDISSRYDQMMESRQKGNELEDKEQKNSPQKE